MLEELTLDEAKRAVEAEAKLGAHLLCSEYGICPILPYRREDDTLGAWTPDCDADPAVAEVELLLEGWNRQVGQGGVVCLYPPA